MEKIKIEEVKKLKDGTIIYNSKTNTWAQIVDNFGGGITIAVEINKVKTTGNMSYDQMYDMLNNKYTDMLRAL